MSSNRQFVRAFAVIAAVLLFSADVSAQPQAGPPPLIKQDARVSLAPHSFTILDDNVSFVPNVGIVVGSRATLVIDTGLGERNGAVVLGEARRVSDNTEFYVAATHFHPEHDLGATAFPPNAKILRWVVQQQDADELGAEMHRRFASFSPIVAELLQGARFRDADVIIEDGVTLDLGGVHVRVWGVGPTHTRGDTAFFVVEDRVLFAGDVVMPVFPSVSGQSGSIAKWIANMDAFEALNPAVVVPAHGRTGDVSMIRRMREYLRAVQSEVAAAKRGGATVEQAVERLAGALAARFPDLAPANGSPAGRINAAIQAAYREAP